MGATDDLACIVAVDYTDVISAHDTADIDGSSSSSTDITDIAGVVTVVHATVEVVAHHTTDTGGSAGATEVGIHNIYVPYGAIFALFRSHTAL